MSRERLHRISEFSLKLFVGLSILFSILAFLTDFGSLFVTARMVIVSLALLIISAIVYRQTEPDSAVITSELVSSESPKKVSSTVSVIYILLAVIGTMFAGLASALNDSGSVIAGVVIFILWVLYLFALHIGRRSRMQ